MKLWLVKADQFEYDAFVSAVVRASSPDAAREFVRQSGEYLPAGAATTFTVESLPTDPGILHLHWHAG